MGRTVREPRGGTVVVVAGGASPAPALVARLRGLEPDAPTIAADSGVDLALALGRRVDLVVGDLDSASPAGLAAARAGGAAVERHPTTKDAADLELALDAALALGPARLVVLGGAAGRLDHLLGGLLLLAAPAYAEVEVTAHLGAATVAVVRGRRRLLGQAGALVSLFALGGEAEGVTTEGLAYPLVDEPLRPGSTRGLSNVFLGPEAEVRLRHGVLVAVLPEPSPPPPSPLEHP